ncbi:MAG: Trk system potassium transporter TrkA [Bacteroidales bacterium]|nr:Trk system potassium transporter TrkA [Bacteroidales bacterium]MBQ3977494.1 Trk system potassium transporter TrkA [Bacteroidales bacterium]MBQ5979280.1 Trk system potassium transporter TrkA [Bacteroidales bacterium]MBQ6184510.1 Trk system potassium transporter TrkA [Bacteroidales bacterium]
MKIVIQGAGEVGSHLAKMLSREDNDITVIDDSAQRLHSITEIADVIAVEGPPSSLKVMREAEVQHADLFISVVPFVPQDVNIVSALLAKNLGAAKVTARIDDNDFLTPENKLLFKQMGIELMFYPERLASDEIFELLKHSSSSESMDFARGRLQVEVFKLEEDSPLLDMKIAEFAAITTKDELQFRVIAISRGGQTIMPKFDTKLMYHDLVFIIATREGMQFLMKFLGKNTVETDKVMILGGSKIAELVADRLSKKISQVKILEKDKERAMVLSEKLDDNVIVVVGDGRNSELLVDEGIKDFDAFLALTGKDEANVLACVVAKKFGVERTIAEVENIEYIHLAEEMGVDSVINKKLITAGRLFKLTLSGKARLVKYMSGTDAEVLEYTVAPGSAITKGALKDLSFPKDSVIGGLIRGSESKIAIGSTKIEAYDRVVVFALPHAVKEVDKFFK